MARIYSRLLAAGSQAAGTVSTVYTCPVGVTAVIKDICLYAGGGVGGFVLVFTSAGGVIKTAVGNAAFTSDQWSGMSVMRPGDLLRVNAFAGAWSYTISGYELAP